MKGKKDKILVSLGMVYIVYWFVDFYKNAVLTHDFSWLLWYSSAGFLLTGIALVTQNVKLIYSLFCALFVIETLWIVDLVYSFLNHHTLIGLTEYILSPTFQIKNFFYTLYHALIPIGLLVAVLRIKNTYKYGWAGATLFVTTLLTLTYFLTSPHSQVNCIHAINKCHSIFSFLYKINYLSRISVAIIVLTLCIFIPTNYILFYFKKQKTHGKLPLKRI